MSENTEIYFTAIKILGKEKYDAYLRAAEVKDIIFLELIIHCHCQLTFSQMGVITMEVMTELAKALGPPNSKIREAHHMRTVEKSWAFTHDTNTLRQSRVHLRVVFDRASLS